MKKLLTTLCMLLLAAALLGTSSYAWFSMNRKADVEGIQVKAKSDSSLVISKDAVPSATTSDRLVDFDPQGTATPTELLVSTHDSTYATYATGLKKVTNQSDVDAATGLAMKDKTLSYAAVTNSSTDVYYIDYVVYVGSSGAAIDLSSDAKKELQISLNSVTKSINSAISVDIYATATSKAISDATTIVDLAHYVGTLSLGGVKNASASTSTAQTVLKISGSQSGGAQIASIPNVAAASGNVCIAFVLRVYVDGALLDAETTGSGSTLKTYIRNADALNIAKTEVKVAFEIKDVTA